MSHDNKREAVSKMNEHLSVLGKVTATLSELENRWGRRTSKIIATRLYLKELIELIAKQGREPYS